MKNIIVHVWKIMGLGVLNIWKFQAKKNINILEQPSYSPNLALCEFFLFPKLKGGGHQEDLFWSQSSSRVL